MCNNNQINCNNDLTTVIYSHAAFKSEARCDWFYLCRLSIQIVATSI